MKIIQSFWSGNQTDFTNNYGWYNYKYNWLSWILSCHQLVKHHKEVELYTDRFGYDILITKLQLPYTKVHVVLDDLNRYHKDLWAMAKIKTFQMQDEPFLHVDGDVFVWESLTDKFKNANLVTQNLEITTDYYGRMWNDISPNLKYMPSEMANYHNKLSNFACNMGIIGGTDINFFKEYTKASIAFVDNNIDSWSSINGFNFNIFFEQVLFYEFTKSKNKKVDFLLEEVSEDNDYKGFGDFQKVPHKTYLHLLGVFKRNASVCKAMEVYIMKYYSESYSKITTLINEAEGNHNEIEFLTTTKISELITKFGNEIKTNDFIPENFLLKRDLFTEGLTNNLENLLMNKLDFTIVLIKGFDKKDAIINDAKFSFLEIYELNSAPRTYELDEIDEIILTELSSPIQYFDFISKMNNYFEDEDEDSKTDFLILLNGRLINYVVLKIISIYR
ncbi:DUF6734 family protein [Flavobacterium restrictum]|uniref:DUF6734 domain-containing protein n=1 Tax=Flavobacterium restrictum TaxID=2594428 RepID=A0A553E8P7_9FLAO|nr:DUF6734 family protein [Flavobacterium restrictum]TRX41434.1 hypothetical protein FNW21_04870 [Flavobacterium restrictum]